MADDQGKKRAPAGRSRSGKPGDRPRSGKPGEKPRSGKPGDKPRSGKPGGKPAGKGRPDTRRPARGDADRPRDPHLADDITADQVDPAVAGELRTLPEGLADLVARHLVAADRALVEGDTATARAHAAAAKRKAGRVAAVREAAGITAYLDGDYAEALAELRAVRRMTGSDAYLPMMADCERGLGRPERALELVKGVDARTVDAATRVELALVAAGARADLGQVDAALLVLQAPELRRLPPGGPRARVEYAYAELLERAGRGEEAREWMLKAAASDVDGVTDAAERVAESEGLLFIEEEFAAEGEAGPGE